MNFWFIYDRINFPISLMLAEMIICSRFGKKDHFILRLLLGILPATAISFIWNSWLSLTPQEGTFLYASLFLLVFLCSFAMMALAFQGDFWAYLFTAIMAYCAQHIAYQSHTLLTSLFRLGASKIADMLILIICTFVVYGLLYLSFVQKLEKNQIIRVNNHFQVILSGIILAITVYVSFYGIIYAAKNNSLELRYVTLLFSILACFLGLLLEMSFVQLKKSEIEVAILKHMVHQAKEQYTQTKENIDLINIKCHDLRHQVSHLSGKVDREELERITEAIAIYDAEFKTGNDALDVILMEKGLHCRKKNIRLTCMIDASVFNKVKDSDIYALFGNAIENAIEGVEDLEEEQRSISISGFQNNGYGIVRIENYYNGAITFKDGLPLTQKSTNYHGFGVKSMKIIVEKYNGEIEFSLHDDIFRLELFFPLAESKAPTLCS